MSKIHRNAPSELTMKTEADVKDYKKQRGRAMLRVCIASIQNVEHSLLLVVSASDIPLRTIKFFSVLFGVFVHAAGRHKQTFAAASPTVRSTVHGHR